LTRKFAVEGSGHVRLLEGDLVAQAEELVDGSVTLPYGVTLDEVVPAQVLVVALVGEQVPDDDGIECATATAAFFLPMRRARRQNWAER